VNALGSTIDAGPHTATASIVSGTGSFVGPNTCTYTGGAATATCTVTITSSSAGTTVVSATSDIPVGGQTITRTTGTAVNTAAGGSGNANKLWILTQVHNSAHADITGTTVTGPIAVHDKFIGAPMIGGTVDFTLFQGSSNCTGTTVPAGSAMGVAVLADGTAESPVVTLSAGGNYSYLAHYNGNVASGAVAGNATCEPFTVSVPQGLITHTNVSCEDVLSGNASNFLVGGINYPNNGGFIGQGIDPGKFFFWTRITTTTPNQVVTVTQTNNSTNNSALIKIHQDWQRIYTANCSSFATGTQINGGSGASFTVPTPGDYIIGIKYDPKSLAGTKVPVPPSITFTFTTSLGGNTGASVGMSPK